MADRSKNRILWIAAVAATALIAVLGIWPYGQGTLPGAADHAATETRPPTEAGLPDPSLVREEASPDSERGASASGSATTLVVRLRSDDGPLPGARIEVHSRLSVLVGRTDPEGAATFYNPPTGPVTLRSARGCETRLEIFAHRTNEVEMVVAGGVDVTGKVVDLAGDPVPRATIYLARPVRMLSEFDPVPLATADDAGRFELSAVPTQSRLGARARGHRVSPLCAVIQERLRGDAFEMTLVVGDEGCDVRGVVRDVMDKPIAGVEVELNGGSARPAPGTVAGTLWTVQRTRTDRQGRFEISGQHPGINKLIIRSASHAYWAEEFELETGAVRDLEICLTPGASVHGVVTTADGTPIQGVTIDRMGRESTWFRGSVPTVTDVHGEYWLTGLAKHEQTLWVRKAGYVAQTPRVVPKSEPPIRLDVVLTPHPRVRGILLKADGSPSVGVYVRGRTVASGRSSGKAVITDARGAFDLALPAPDSWKLYLSWAPGGIDIDAGSPVLQGARDDLKITVDGNLEPSAFLRGSVLEPDGKPSLGASLQLRAAGVLSQPEQLRAAGFADMVDGSFRVGPLSPGRYWLRVHSTSPGTARADYGPFQLTSGQHLELGTLQPSTGAVLLRTRFPAGVSVDGVAVLVTIYEARTRRSIKNLGLQPGESIRITLPPGKYFVGCVAKGFSAKQSSEFTTTVGSSEEVEITFRAKPGRD